MKKISLLIILFFLTVGGFCQSQRLVILEEFTSSTCGPCASVNPTFHNWQVQNPDKFTSIYYHVNWPAAGDPMNLANPQENGARVSYYGVTYVPESNLDGNYYNGSANSWNMNTVNARYAVPSPFEINVKHQLSSGEDSVFSTMLVKCTQAVSGSLVAHNVIIEKWIHFNSPPGSNGEKDFYNVMKKMLPGSNGTTMPTSMVPGDYVLLEGAWKFGTVYDKTQIAAVGFVQDKSTKEIHQSANSTTDALIMPYNTDLQVMEVKNIPTYTCKNKMTPMVQIRNNGNNTITSMTIQYRVNDEAINTFTWNGSLSTLQKTILTLPEIQYNILSSNILTVYTSGPNSIADEYPKNDTLNFAFHSSPVSTDKVNLVLRTDNAPQDITWDVKNSLGVTIDQGGPYALASHAYLDTIQLPQSDCYTFTIYDAGGNGICCSNGTGVYEINSGGTIIKQGGQFGFSESSEFWLESPTSVKEFDHATGVNIFPNPFNQSANVSFSLDTPANVTLTLFSAFGQKIQTRTLGLLSSGTHETVVDGQELKPGIYILQLNTGTKIESRKVTVIH
ncbi:MAG: T9SS type A sorting domain-containing protein [Bacteroidales bacterium]|nr:T9SS type A sorting domain-containing protein [Bacteroidales bacterium]